MQQPKRIQFYTVQLQYIPETSAVCDKFFDKLVDMSNPLVQCEKISERNLKTTELARALAMVVS